MSVARTSKKTAPYVQLEITALNDARLSFRAKGLHTYLMSKPNNWRVYIKQLAKESPKEGREAIAGALKELEDAGYIRRKRLRNTQGRMEGWDTKIYETPELAQDDTAFDQEIPPPFPGEDTENGFADLGLTEVGKTEVGKTVTSYKGLKEEELKEVNLESTHTPYPSGGMGGDNGFAASFNRQAQVEAHEVLAYLNKVTKRDHKNPTLIAALLDHEATVAECTLVIDWWQAVKVVEQPNQAINFNASTPFKPEHFDDYRAAAQQWHEQGRRTPGPTGSKVSAKGLRNLAVTQQLLKEDGLV